jgi:hypothetical protein
MVHPAPQVRAVTTAIRWFTTSHTIEVERVGGVLTEWPVSLAHGKQMGSTTTACGLSTVSWPKLFHLSFPPEVVEACPECLQATSKPRQRLG